MNKIQRIVFTMACLLTFTGGYAWKIAGLVKEGDGGAGATFTATYNSIPVVVNSTDIPASSNVTLTIALSGNDYYLKKLEYEYVMDLGGAESRWNRALGPGFATRGTIAINTDHAHSYAGDYNFTMPASDVVIYATFAARTDISSFSLTLDGTAASKVYDGYEHVLTLKNGDTPLTIDVDYTISPSKDSWINVFSATPTVTGIGKYKGTINSTTLSITQRDLTITAKAQTISYGSSIQTGDSQVNITGLVANDGLTSITLTPSTSQVTNTGTMTPSAATTTKGISNYNVTYNTGTLTIQAYDLSAVALSEEVLDIELDHEYFNYITGTLQKAQVTSIKYQTTPLVSGTSYTYYYEAGGVYGKTDYISPDIYTIVITFCGNYTGTKRINYQIRPQITRTGSNWTTYYYNQYEMRVPSGLEAYTVSSITSTQVGTTSQNYLLRGVPMLIYRTGDTQSFYPELVSPGSATINGTPDPAFIGTDSNLDMATATSSDPSNDYWILKSNQFVRTKSGSLDSNKCYLKLPKTQFSSPSISLSRGLDLDDETTSIDGISKMEEVRGNVYYDLNGRRVLYPTKGIYIVNGKKIVIK